MTHVVTSLVVVTKTHINHGTWTYNAFS